MLPAAGSKEHPTPILFLSYVRSFVKEKVMSTEASPFDSAIAEVEARIEALHTTLETLRQLRAQAGAAIPQGASRATGGGESEVQHDSFFGMTIGDAAKKYLNFVKATRSTADIGGALERGGLKHASKDFNTTVRSVLGGREDFLRVNGDWGLTEWYPGQGRGKKAKPEKQATPRAGKPKSKPTEKATPTDGLTRRERILRTMRTDPSKGWTAGEIAMATSDKRKLVQATLSTMDGIVRADTGGYRVADAA
jgi:hypothetical protein